MKHTRALLLCSLSAALSGCSGVSGLMDGLTSPVSALFGGKGEPEDEKGPAEPKEPEAKRTVVGTVRFSYEGFVLIYTPTRIPIPAGTKATTIGKDGEPQDVELRISEERKNTFLVADVVKGSPKAGQVVVATIGGKSSGAGSASQYQVLP